jgi:hypothetical protein
LDTAPAEAPAEKPPRWNVVSIVVPLLGAGVGLIQASGGSSGGNMGAAMGAAIAFMAFVVLGSVVGFIAAIIAVARTERMAWLSVIGLLLNGAVLLPIVFFLLKG